MGLIIIVTTATTTTTTTTTTTSTAIAIIVTTSIADLMYNIICIIHPALLVGPGPRSSGSGRCGQRPAEGVCTRM